MFKSVFGPSIIVFLIIFINANIIYAIAHYATGNVVIPEWYMKDKEFPISELMPVMPFIYYWIERGLIISSIYAAIAFSLVFVFTTLNYRKKKVLVISKNN